MHDAPPPPLDRQGIGRIPVLRYGAPTALLNEAESPR
jgi:hypothetical protein